MEKEYKYVLKYINGDNTSTMEFNASVTADELVHYLRDFLCSASWSDDAIKDILNIEEEESEDYLEEH